MKFFKKGSEWRKWDLHVHTPASVLSSGFGNDWDEFVKKLFSTAIEQEIYAIGITDYFFIDGYKKIRNEYLDNQKQMDLLFSEEDQNKIKNILLIPNIEFRLNKFVSGNTNALDRLNRKLNYHVLLSNDLSPEEIENNFLIQLKFDYSSDIGVEQEKRPLTKSNLELLGKRLKTEHEKFRGKTDIFVGLMLL